MQCNYKIDGECTFPIATSCETACPYMRLLEDYTELQQTYKACYNEHLKVVEQNKQLQAEVKDLEELAEFKEKRIRELYNIYKQLEEETKLTS